MLDQHRREIAAIWQAVYATPSQPMDVRATASLDLTHDALVRSRDRMPRF